MDHSDKRIRKKNPRDSANIFSLLTFSYLGGLWKKSYKNQLHDDNLYDVIEQCRSKNCGDRLEEQWKNEQKTQRNPSLLRVIWQCWGGSYLILATVDIIFNVFFSVIRPYILSRLVTYFAPGNTYTTRNEAYFFAGCMLLLHLANLTYVQNFSVYIQALGTEIKTSISSMLYRKSLKLSPAGLADVSLGQIVTLITRDVQSFVSLVAALNDTLIAFTQIATIGYLLFMKVGFVSLAGVGIFLSAIPLQIYMGYWITRVRLQTGNITDKRLQITQEILSTIRIIKMYTWEAFFAKNVIEARRKEATKILLGTYLKRLVLYVGILFCNAGFYTLLMICIWSGVSTDISMIFYIISNFKDLRKWLAIVVPYGMGSASEFIAAYKRIVKALDAEELHCEFIDQRTEEPLLEFKNVTVHIKETEILKNVSFKLTSGLTCITGTVGSGKSSIFKTILRDYVASNGLVATNGRISYASQEPWLFPSSIKQNILFGESYNEKRYNKVLRVCALSYDLSLLEKGDQTILIDRGLNFSKGQQARINLARAVYRDSEIYILDDCLTALDATVQNYIFEECIKKFLEDKICVLVSQTASHINEADNVIVMDTGRVKYFGTPNEQILQKVKELVVDEDGIENEIIDEKHERNETEPDEKSKLIEIEQDDAKKTNAYGETNKEGSIDFRVYKKYFIYGGGTVVVILNLIFRCCTTFSVNYSDKLLTNWVDNKQNVIFIENNLHQVNTSNNTLLEEAIIIEQHTFKLYSIFLFLSSALEIFTTYLLVNFCKTSSINMHKALVEKIMKAVMSFFDNHLVGNILNRFSQDMFNVDESLAYALDQSIRTLFTVGGILILLILVNKEMIIIAFLTLSILLVLRSFYQPTGRCLKRLEASTRSPMVGHLNATLEGLTTIRACKIQNILIEEYDKHQDLYTSAHFLGHCSNRAFGFIVDLICSTFILFVLVKFLFFYTNTTAGDIGLSLTQVVFLTGGINWAIRQWADLENNMTSLERILEYTDIQTEKKDGTAFEHWPSTGTICYKNVSLSYNNSDNYVLKNLNFEIKDKQKIGIVGRTGAGKSSILSTMFRLYDVKGTILMDGINTKNLDLDFLRKHIAVIPQDPVIFSGSIRTNLDPLYEFKDHEIWEALDRVGMKKQFSNLNQEINTTISNLSSGQKQLICLSRAILRKNKIVVMDEATANMDHQTDDTVLCRIVKENFSDCTILTIAHRLHTVMDCDRVMVLDKGEIKEFDSPKVLLENQNGMFYKMVEQVGLINK